VWMIWYKRNGHIHKGVIPSARHRAIAKLAGKTNQVEHFTCTLRQRAARLVRATLSFSKKVGNHSGALRYFSCDDNLTRSVALPGWHCHFLHVRLWLE